MKRTEVHRCWAPDAAPWSPWVKPVLFAAMDDEVEPSPLQLDRRVASWFARIVGDDPQRATYRASHSPPARAVVIDLPGVDGLHLALATIAHGFRPIPLYNALPGATVDGRSTAIVDMHAVMQTLVDGCDELSRTRSDASPAFVLDARRMDEPRALVPGLLDNRSVFSASDVPTAATLRRAGIERVLVVADVLRDDLEIVLAGWERGGLSLAMARPARDEPPTSLSLRWRVVPAWIRATMRRALFAPRADGSYGRVVLDRSSHG